jgi:high affinity sulfate transporter 1
VTTTPPPSTPPGPGADALPGLALLRRYQRAWLRPDLVAGLTVGAMLVPQSMAYAELAGAPPSTGLYAALLAPVAYALTGSSRHLGTGPEPGTAILAAAGVAAVGGAGEPGRYLALMAALALLVAAVCGLARLLRLGFIASVLSKPVLVGYITGVGMVLLASQLGAFTGVTIESGDFFPRVAEFAAEAAGTSVLAVLVGVATLAVMEVLRRTTPRIPPALVAVGGATLVAWLLDLPDRGLATIGAIPTGLPAVGLPAVGGSDIVALLPAALSIALVGYTDNVLTGRSIARRMGYRIDAETELTGLAAANLAAGLTQGMPVSSSASRTAVPAALGSVTQVVSLVASGIMALTLLFAGPVLAAVPRPALAAVIVAAALAIIDIPGFRSLWRMSRAEFALAGVTAFGVMVFGVLPGVLIAVGLSVAVALARMAQPEDAVLGANPDLDGWVAVDTDPATRTLPGLLVYRFDAPLFFLNAERFRKRLITVLDENPGAEEWVILDFEGIGEIDTTALDELAELVDELLAEGVDTVAVARPNARTRARLLQAGLLVPNGHLQTFPTINAAVRAFEQRG